MFAMLCSFGVTKLLVFAHCNNFSKVVDTNLHDANNTFQTKSGISNA